MRWNLTQSTDQINRWKLDENETAEIKYNKGSHSFRITANDKRLFFMDRTGFFQNKFLIRTEYSVLAGEVLPKKAHSGIVVFENKKYNYVLEANLITLFSKKEDFKVIIEVAALAELDQSELYALLFGTARVFTKINAAQTESLFA